MDAGNNLEERNRLQNLPAQFERERANDAKE
jgi:hypothetical protein